MLGVLSRHNSLCIVGVVDSFDFDGNGIRAVIFRIGVRISGSMGSTGEELRREACIQGTEG